MAGFVGRDIVLEWNNAVILGVREKGIAINGEAVNVTSDEDNGWQTLLEESGEQSIEISLSGVTKSNVLKQEWFNGTKIRTAEIEYPNGDILTGTFRLSSYTDTGPYNDATTFEATLQSTGVVTFTPYS
jgi:TP901-1 family phage major tail protein